MDRVAFVAGASRGIGRATAIRVARDFGAVVLVAQSRDTPLWRRPRQASPLRAPDSQWITGTALRVDGGETRLL